jgi:hypothetical protein
VVVRVVFTDEAVAHEELVIPAFAVRYEDLLARADATCRPQKNGPAVRGRFPVSLWGKQACIGMNDSLVKS